MTRFLELLLNLRPGELAGADEWWPRLVAAPTNAWAIMGIALAAALLVWLTVRSYLREGETPRRAKLALAGIRVAVIALVLATLLQPALTLRKVHTDHATVAILLDDSLSMLLPDTYDQGQKDALAAAAGIDQAELATLSRSQIVRRLLERQQGPIAALAKEHPLMLIRFSTAQPEREGYTEGLAEIDMEAGAAQSSPAGPPSQCGIAIAATVAGVMALWVLGLLTWAVVGAIRRKPVPAGAPGHTSQGAPTWALISGAIACLAALAAGAYAANSHRIRGEMLREATETPAAQQRPPALVQTTAAMESLAGRGYETDLRQAIHEAADRLRGRRVAALVVVSDGQNTSALPGEDPLRSLRGFCNDRNIPLACVAVGSEAPARNIRVASLAIPRQIRRAGQTPVRVTLESRNCRGESARVQLLVQKAGEDNWEPAGAEQTVTLEGDAPAADGKQIVTTVVDLPPLEAAELGQFTYKAVVAKRDDELLGNDNEAVARVTVTDDKVRVLLVSGDAGWEYQYLRNFLLRDPQRFLASCWQQNAEADFNQEASTAGMQLARLPRTLVELTDRYDVVVLYDPFHEVGSYDPEFVEALRQFVDKWRGGLCYIASNKHTSQHLYAPDRASAGEFVPMVDMLPVVLSGRSLQVAERIGRGDDRVGWPIRLTGVGAESPVMQLAEDPQAGRAVWDRMPGVFWSHAIARLKPAAVALAISSDPAQRTDDGDPLPVIATQLYGGGPVLYVGFDDSWRWRYLGEAGYYRRFWGNVVEYLASYRMLRKQVLITVAGETFTVGERIGLTAEVFDDQLAPVAGPQFTVGVVGSAGQKAPDIVLKPDARGPQAGRAGLYRGSLLLTEPGQYMLTAPSHPADQVAEKFITVLPPQQEYTHPEADYVSLRDLSGEERFYTADQVDVMAAEVPPARLDVVQETTRELWNLWLAAAVLVMLLIVEWIGRKKYNMT